MIKLTNDKELQSKLDSLGFALGLVPVRITRLCDMDIQSYIRDWDLQMLTLSKVYDPFDSPVSFELQNPYICVKAR